MNSRTRSIRLFCVEFEPVKMKLMIGITVFRLMVLNFQLSHKITLRFVLLCTVARQVTFFIVNK